MKVLVYGSKGWIGGMFMDFLLSKGVTAVAGDSRIDSEYLIDELIEKSPTHVITFIGRTHGVIDGNSINTIDYLEYPGKLLENIRDNLYSPVVLADLCLKHGIHYTYLGTGCIFDGLEEPFKESDLPNYFGSGYSIVKGFTDRLMHSRDILNLRIRMPISTISNPRNFINKIINYTHICSIPNSMTVLDDFFPVFLDLISKNKVGTYNCTNPGLISHNEILQEYRDIVDPSFTWNNMTLEEQSKLLKSARSNNYLDTSKIEKEYPDIPGIKESIKSVILKFKEA